jgi:hypothetical protein
MHRCEEFRERITEHIIDGEDVAHQSEFQDELMMCVGCAEFYADSRDMMEALSSIDLSISESQWSRIEHRLRARIVNENETFTPHISVEQAPPLVPARRRAWMKVPVWIATAALLVTTIGLSRVSAPIMTVKTPVESVPQTVYIENTVPLDPVTVDFLEKSELLLRNVMKIAPGDAEDLADAKKAANEQLAEVKLRKEAAADVLPVVDMMDTYETVLRDLRNVDARSASEDIPDIQRRIQRNALIANMKSFQPAVTQVNFNLR